MASKRVPNEGKLKLVDIMTGKAGQENFTLKLFTNNVTPADTDTAATYTEMTGQGYAAATITMANWDAAVMSGAYGQAAYPEQTFMFNAGGPATIYGHYVVSATTGKLLWVVKWDTARVIQYQNDTIKITPTLGMDDEVA